MRDIRAVQELTTPDFAVFVQLAATVGARRGTLVALRWGDVDLGRGTIIFSRSIAESREGTVEKGTKADRSYAVTLGPDTKAELVGHADRAKERAAEVGVTFGPRSFVFSDDGGASHWSLAWPSHAWERYSARAGIVRLRLHDLRHTAASQMLMAGVPISVVAERLGCSEGNILRTYRHYIPGSDQEAAELMDRLLRATPSDPVVPAERGGLIGSGGVDQAVERPLGDEDLAAQVGHPREHSSSHHPPDRVLRHLENLGALGDCVNGRLAGAEAAQVGARLRWIARSTAVSIKSSMLKAVAVPTPGRGSRPAGDHARGRPNRASAHTSAASAPGSGGASGLLSRRSR